MEKQKEQEKLVLIGELYHAAGTGEDYIAFLADETDPEEFALALARGSVTKIIHTAAGVTTTRIIPAASIRRLYFSQTTLDTRKYKAIEIEFYDKG